MHFQKTLKHVLFKCFTQPVDDYLFSDRFTCNITQLVLTEMHLSVKRWRLYESFHLIYPPHAVHVIQVRIYVKIIIKQKKIIKLIIHQIKNKENTRTRSPTRYRKLQMIFTQPILLFSRSCLLAYSLKNFQSIPYCIFVDISFGSSTCLWNIPWLH